MGEQTPHTSTSRSKPRYPPNNTAGHRGESRTIPWTLISPGALHEPGQQHGWIFSRYPSGAVECFSPATPPRKSSSSSPLHTVVSADQWSPRIQPWGKQHGSAPSVPAGCHAGDPSGHKGFHGRSGFYYTTTRAGAFSPGWIQQLFFEPETRAEFALPRPGLPIVVQPCSRSKATLADPPSPLDPLSGTRVQLER
jgi:hypothetical protein